MDHLNLPVEHSAQSIMSALASQNTMTALAPQSLMSALASMI